MEEMRYQRSDMLSNVFQRLRAAEGGFALSLSGSKAPSSPLNTPSRQPPGLLKTNKTTKNSSNSLKANSSSHPQYWGHIGFSMYSHLGSYIWIKNSELARALPKQSPCLEEAHLQLEMISRGLLHPVPPWTQRALFWKAEQLSMLPNGSE